MIGGRRRCGQYKTGRARLRVPHGGFSLARRVGAALTRVANGILDRETRMKGRRALCLVGCGVVFLGAVYAFQRPFHQYPGVEYYNFELTPDWQEKGEGCFGRLMFL